MPIAFLGKVSAGSTNGTSVTSAAIDTTGADFLVVMVADGNNGASVSDSKSNSWSSVTGRTTANGAVQIFYSVPSSVGSGHTFSATSAAPVIFAMAFNGVLQSSPADQQNGATSASSANLSSGSITPSQNNELLIAGYASSSGVSGTPAPPLLWADNVASLLVGGQHYTGDAAFLMQSTAAAISVSFPTSGAQNCAVTIASFKAAATGGVSGGAWAYA